MGNYVPSLPPLRYDTLIYFDPTIAVHPLHQAPMKNAEPIRSVYKNLLHAGYPGRTAAARGDPEDPDHERDSRRVPPADPAMFRASPA